MMEIDCNCCGNKLEVPGALLFSPPDRYGNTKKFHICVPCWQSSKSVQIKF